ncbi:hypothetical protein B0A48_12595 [Cryoendolithus antarcticus]|uniref:RNA polymerase II-associated protein 1 N-terminal domain-containing protein n=1 Tax=Cryoendolithus antarcticus TaxID=1507870 RepID=A0A1V8SR65_9PEZI|nr:hypothetical protein B0A48_12595 [Cryoendolithus antarcticus]
MVRGERFEIDLDQDELAFKEPSKPFSGAFVGDVLERKPSTPKPVAGPIVKSRSGFPEHGRRPAQSRFKRKQDSRASIGSNAAPNYDHAEPRSIRNAQDIPPLDLEKASIDRQNRDVLAGMSEAEIEEARQEIMGSMNPDVLQSLLRRANIDSGATALDSFDGPHQPMTKDLGASNSTKAKRVTFDDPEELSTARANLKQAPHDQDDDQNGTPTHLAWMQPSTTPAPNSYLSSVSALSPAALRFNFTGALLPPKTSASIPVSAGLHHHGLEPEAAGYTIPELAILSRSTYPAQRAIAFQTLGRLLYRLGVGEFGDPAEAGAETVGAEETMGELARGLWREMAKERVIETLVSESSGQGIDGGRHVSAKAYATEAVWLWRRGGGQHWKAD